MTKILVIEDDQDNLALITLLLQSSGLSVITAENGEEGLEKIRTLRPTLVLLDLGIPIINGWEIARRVKTTPELATTTLVAITAHASQKDREEALEAGCDGFITKPLDIPNFVEKVKSYL